MKKDVIELRTGHFSSIFITLNSASLTVIKRALTKKVKKSPLFFQNVPVILKFTSILHKIDLNALKNLLEEFNIHIIGVSDWQNSLEKELIITANLPTLGKSEQFEEILPEYGYLPPKIIFGNVKGNDVIYAKNSDLIINGDVLKGAEVVAEGNIHIYGKLQGRAMAGINNKQQALLYVQSLEAEFISVCKHFLYQANIPEQYWGKSVMTFPQNGKLAFQSFYRHSL